MNFSNRLNSAFCISAVGARRLRSGTGSGPLVMRVPEYTPGRKSDDQIWLPAYGMSGASTTKHGRFWFSVPSPYVTHDPTLGRLNVTEPVWMPSVA